jgi:hypothetical protein
LQLKYAIIIPKKRTTCPTKFILLQLIALIFADTNNYKVTHFLLSTTPLGLLETERMLHARLTSSLDGEEWSALLDDKGGNK